MIARTMAAQNRAREEASIEPPPDWPNLELSRHVSAEGLSWHVQRGGEGPTLVLFHGTGSSTHSFADLLPGLAERYDVIALDLPGHAFTDPLSDWRLTIDRMSGAICALLKKLNVNPHALIGHSAGAAIALYLRVSGRSDAKHVVGINAALTPYGGMLNALFSPLAKGAAALPLLPDLIARRAQNAASVRRMLESTGSQVPPDSVARYQTLLRNPRHVRATLNMMAHWDLKGLFDESERVGDGVHLLVGDVDRAVSPALARGFARRHPNVALTELPGLGHLAHEEAPGRVLDVLNDVLRGRT